MGRHSDLAGPREERESTRCVSWKGEAPLKHPACFLQEAGGESIWEWPLDLCPAPAAAIREVVVVAGCWKQPGVGSAVTDELCVLEHLQNGAVTAQRMDW